MLQFPIWKRALLTAICVIGLVIAAEPVYARVERSNDAALAISRGAEITRTCKPRSMAGRAGFCRTSSSILGSTCAAARMCWSRSAPRRPCRSGWRLWPTLRDRLRDLHDSVGSVRHLTGSSRGLRIRLGNPAGMADALDAVRAASQPVFSLTGAGSRDFEAVPTATCWS